MIKEKSKILKYISSNDGIKIAIPNFYIPIKDGRIKNLKDDLKEMEVSFEKK
jgi:hypothetical protein